MTHFNIIEVPINSGQPKLGVSNGSNKIWQKLENHVKEADASYKHERISDLVIKASQVTETVLDEGLAPTKNAHINGQANKRIAEHIVSRICGDSLTVTLGGDHSLALGTVYGHAEALHQRQADMAVIWVDAHADINLPPVSESGNLHGMPLGFLTDHRPARLLGHTWVKDPARVKFSNLAYIGLRAVDDYEKDLLAREKVLAFYMEDVRKLGIEKVMQQIFERFQLGPEKKLHVSYDIDSMDPSLAPSTGTTAPNGLTLEEGLYIMHAVHEQGHVEVVDMVEVNPTLGSEADAEMTVDLAHILLKVVMGLTTMQDANKEFTSRYVDQPRGKQ